MKLKKIVLYVVNEEGYVLQFNFNKERSVSVGFSNGMTIIEVAKTLLDLARSMFSFF